MTQSQSSANAPFDRRLLRQRRNRAALALSDHDFLIREAGARLLERVVDEKQSYPLALDLGCHRGEMSALLAQTPGHGIHRVVHSDLAFAMASATSGLRLVADEEALPFAPGVFDLAISVLSLHSVNDLPGCLAQLRRILRPGAVFLGAMFGGETLHELRHCLAQAEMACEDGLSPRISPFADVRDAGALLQRAGFARPVADVDTISVSYSDLPALMRELRGMGESNILHARRRQFLRRETLAMAAKLYQESFAGPDGRIKATFQIINLTGWAAGETAADSEIPKPRRLLRQ